MDKEPSLGDMKKLNDIYQKLINEKDNLETECSILTDILVRKHTQNMENRKLIVTKERKPKVSSDVVAEVAEGSITENPIEEEESEVTSK